LRGLITDAKKRKEEYGVENYWEMIIMMMNISKIIIKGKVCPLKS